MVPTSFLNQAYALCYIKTFALWWLLSKALNGLKY